jgi:hypothetical protein
MENNLWQIENRDKLLSFLMDSKKKITVLTVVMSNSSENNKIMLRKYIKSKSKIYKNVNFVYYVVKKNDFDTIIFKNEKNKNLNLLPNDNGYPRIWHLFDCDKCLGEIFNICDESELKQSDFVFNKLGEYYLNYKQPTNVRLNIQTNSSNSNNSNNHIQENIQKKEDVIPQVKIFEPSNQIIKEENNIDYINENKKLLEKIQIVQQQGEEFKTTFIKDIQKRKEKEKKRNKN